MCVWAHRAYAQGLALAIEDSPRSSWPRFCSEQCGLSLAEMVVGRELKKCNVFTHWPALALIRASVPAFFFAKFTKVECVVLADLTCKIH